MDPYYWSFTNKTKKGWRKDVEKRPIINFDSESNPVTNRPQEGSNDGGGFSWYVNIIRVYSRVKGEPIRSLLRIVGTVRE